MGESSVFMRGVEAREVRQQHLRFRRAVHHDWGLLPGISQPRPHPTPPTHPPAPPPKLLMVLSKAGLSPRCTESVKMTMPPGFTTLREGGLHGMGECAQH